MNYRNDLQTWFGHLPLAVDDLFLLERFQLLALRVRAPEPALGRVLAADDRLRRFMVTRCPELSAWLDEIVGRADMTCDLANAEEALVWELADQLVYQRFPEAYDAMRALRWDPAQLADVCKVEGRVVVDIGAGTGWLSEALAGSARTVFAVEPVSRLREYIRERAAAAGHSNLFVIDGFLDRVPLPPASVDVLLTSRAIGWRLADELREVERIVRPAGHAVHFVGTPADGPRTPLHDELRRWGYEPSRYREGGGWRDRYAKVVGSTER